MTLELCPNAFHIDAFLFVQPPDAICPACGAADWQRPDSLDAAWAAAEVVLPDGWSMGGIIQRHRSGDGWQAIAMRLSDSAGYPDAATIEGELAHTPAAALRSLVIALSESQP